MIIYTLGDRKERDFKMFGNVNKKFAKYISWKALRNAQHIAVRSKFGLLPGIDQSRLLVGLGVFGTYAILKLSSEKANASESHIHDVEKYIFKCTPRYVHDLLAEYRLPQLGRDVFKEAYLNMLDAISMRNEDEPELFIAAIFAFEYSSSDDEIDVDKVAAMMETHWEEFKALLIMECEEWGPLLPLDKNPLE